MASIIEEGRLKKIDFSLLLLLLLRATAVAVTKRMLFPQKDPQLAEVNRAVHSSYSPANSLPSVCV